MSRLAWTLGAVLLALGALLATVERSAFEADAFGARVAESLRDPRVAAFAGDRITRAVLDQSPDLTAVRPLILATATGLAGSEPFRAVARTAAASGHRAVFAEGTRRVVLSVPDVGVLLRSAFERASPELAARIPDRLLAAVASLEAPEATEVVVNLWRLRAKVRSLGWTLLAASLALLGLGAALAEDRRRALVGTGAAGVAAGLASWAAGPLAGGAVAAAAPDALSADALVGLTQAFLAPLGAWALFLTGLGVLFAAAGTSLIEAFEPFEELARAARFLAIRPASRAARAAWGAGLLGLGAAVAWNPLAAAACGVVLAGTAVAFVGARELFRLLLDSVEAAPLLARQRAARRSRLRELAAVVLLGVAIALWAALRAPQEAPDPVTVTACNGHAALCGRFVDAVSFAGAHNAMSNTSIPDWLFPHHRASIVQQLRDGVRALLIDVHYGFAGGSRIKTDLSGERPTREVLLHAIGEQGLDAALRARETLVGVDEGRRDLYLCHGFCELGAYRLEPTLSEIHDFSVGRPGEVLLLVIEDYVSPQDLALAFEQSGLAERVYRGPSGPPWPTLGELVASGQPVVVFIESGSAGVPWLRPAFELIQETPYTFHTPQEFSCRPNRGPADASLFQLNHWIETTPAPRPSNAEIVNGADVLGPRAERCRQERGRLPNLVAVDFYGIGDLLSVVDGLNGLAEP